MSIESVQEIIGKAVVDGEYRELLFSEPGKAIESYDLTEEEKSALKGMEREKFDSVASELEDRISRGGLISYGKIELQASFNKLFGGKVFNTTELLS